MRVRTALRRAVTLAVATAAVIAIFGVPVAGSAGRYVDATGDSGTAPDITGVTLSGDATGQAVFTIAANVPSAGDVGFLLMLDTDLNGATGEPGTAGADYAFEVDPAEKLYDFGRWTGAEWDWDPPSETVRVFANQNAVTISVNRSNLGGATVFNFWTRTWLDDAVDDAPDHGLWNYSFGADGPEIRSVVVMTSPGSGPKAGRRFTLTPVGLTLPPSAEPPLLVPRPESYSCRAKLAGRALRGTGVGGCSWALPKSARKQKLMVAVNVGYGGATKTLAFAYRVT